MLPLEATYKIINSGVLCFFKYAILRSLLFLKLQKYHTAGHLHFRIAALLTVRINADCSTLPGKMFPVL